MNASVEDLLQTIGELTVEGRLLRIQVGALSTQLTNLQKKQQEENTKEDKKEK